MDRNSLISQLIKDVFEKAEQESGENTAYGLSKYLSQQEEVGISERNLSRWYNGYMLGKEAKRKPDAGSLEQLSKYLGYESFKQYYGAYMSEVEELKSRHQDEKRKTANKFRWLAAICIALGISLGIFAYSNFERKCMVWVGDHYKKVRCRGNPGEVALDKTLLQNQKKIVPCDSTVFFKDGKARIWYNKSDNTYTFFTHPGLHPVNGKDLDEVSRYIIEKHLTPLQSCDSVLTVSGLGR